MPAFSSAAIVLTNNKLGEPLVVFLSFLLLCSPNVALLKRLAFGGKVVHLHLIAQGCVLYKSIVTCYLGIHDVQDSAFQAFEILTFRPKA